MKHFKKPEHPGNWKNFIMFSKRTSLFKYGNKAYWKGALNCFNKDSVISFLQNLKSQFQPLWINSITAGSSWLSWKTPHWPWPGRITFQAWPASGAVHWHQNIFRTSWRKNGELHQTTSSKGRFTPTLPKIPPKWSNQRKLKIRKSRRPKTALHRRQQQQHQHQHELQVQVKWGLQQNLALMMKGLIHFYWPCNCGPGKPIQVNTAILYDVAQKIRSPE